MNASLHKRVLETIRRHKMLHPGEAVGLAVSGGADSVALLRLFLELRDVLGVRLLMLHLNHQLRGRESEADEQFVARLAAEHGLELLTGREDVAAAARQNGWNLEDAARRLRYRFFSAAVNSSRASRVAVAHTADDQAETVLAHLLRGTGPAGLAAIHPVAGPAIRPLLDVRRAELRAYLEELQQPWREDSTNRDPARLRNRIRLQLLPQLEREFQPAVVTHLNQLAALAREDESFWAALLEDRCRALVEPAPTGLAIRVSDLLAPFRMAGLGGGEARRREEAIPHPALTKRLVRRILAELKGDLRQITARHVEQVLHLATACSSGHCVHLPSGVVVERNFDRLLFSRSGRATTGPGEQETKPRALPYQYVVELEGRSAATVSIPEIGRRFSLKVIDWPTVASDTSTKAEVLDRDLVRSPLVFRNWRPGDCYRPRGRRHTRKLKRLLLERRVAARERRGWPVLTSAGALAWARGLPVAEEFAPRAGTKAGLVIGEEEL